MPRNLAELARAALTAGHTQGAGTAHVADTCVRDGLGFALLFHRRKDGHFAEELYFSTRIDDESWTAADHLSGGVMGIDPTSALECAGILNGRSLVPFGESETALCTGRTQADDGYELLRFHELLVDEEASHLAVDDTSPEADPARGRIHKSLVSQVALVALFPGERLSVRPVVRKGTKSYPLGEPYELTGPDS
ncbi:hypothetical protein ACQEV4_26565 [Streptomyces shenzhenensis]|uniref:hypothetical protein n=1 Tax=Streptomyces shenzhenensis TaxID=943815 RepID=UPI003D90926C